MTRSIVMLAFAALLSGSISGQSAVKQELLPGDWHCCGVMALAIDDVAHFVKDVSACKVNDCLNLRWVINKKGSIKVGLQKGCRYSKIGFSIKASYDWTFRENEELFTIIRKNISEEYTIIQLTDRILTVKRMK